ncbi:PRC-barrel domain-containing protein [uncultured Polaribacter sp.]|uniref:PRC-barrel domain-containing protein n=1 Tax=uncultured Polaribacter sp. TaxID=174711 RepID=UPI00261154FD|nr:PRC-barrel domain-containing protein [uncultured Polaribacter sp.]
MSKEKNLYYLEELSDYKVANSDKDVRGWVVKDANGKVIGKVDNLLVNKKTERVVYLDVEVDTSIIDANHKPFNSKAEDGVHGFINEDGENHIIIPIGMADLNLEDEIVSTNQIDHTTFLQTKRVKKGTPINRDYEVIVFDTYIRQGENFIYPLDDKFYDQNEFNS